MDLLTLFIIIGALMLVALFVAMALGRAADEQDFSAESRTIADLGHVTSPSGKSFFPDGEAVWDLADTLDDVPAEPSKPSHA